MTASGTGLGYGEGDESYGYDSCGYLKAQSAGRHRISEETDQYAGGHRLKQAGNTQYDYDAAGRMVSRTKHRDGYRPETERFRWDSRDQLTGYCSAQGELWEYRHDASGRRTEKRCDRKKIRFTYLWDGDRMEKLGIKVIRKADKYLPPNARAAFDYGLRNIYLRKNATLYEVYHEVIHAKQFAKIGREAYEALGRLSREEHVLNEILKSKNLFNEAEIAHAIKYVEGLREKFMMGLIN
ncbi:hypothetical protein PSA90_004974 [Escherichia coli]|nr:hypothetical protein [Escherichia coli]